LAKLPTALEAIADMEAEIEEEEDDSLLLTPPSAPPRGVLGWSFNAARFLTELQGRDDLPEEVREKAEALVLALHRAFPRDNS
jgi:hypothetical protein